MMMARAEGAGVAPPELSVEASVRAVFDAR